MRAETKQAVVEFVKRFDPRGKIVKLLPTADLRGGTIEFSRAITQHRVETALTGEKYAEAYYAVKLVNELGYMRELLELQKEYEIGRPKINRPRTDIILNRPDGTPFFFIEAKDPDDYEDQAGDAIRFQLFELAKLERERGLKYLAYVTVDSDGGSLFETAQIIDFERYRTYDDWIAKGSFSVDLFPADYGHARKATFVNKPHDRLESGERALNQSAGPSTFAAVRRNLHDVLWAGGGMFYNDIFTNLVKLFLAKIYDEETCPEGSAYKFQIESIDGSPQSSSDLYRKINGIYREAQRDFLGVEENEESRGIDIEKISRDKVFYVVERMQQFSLVKNTRPENGDILGSFFEGIVEQGFKQSRGQFFTHHNIVQFMIRALRIPERSVELIRGEQNRASPRLPFICDPSAGSGTFLIEAMKSVTREVAAIDTKTVAARTRQAIGALLPNVKPNKWADQFLYGVEINNDLALATKVNMVVHGDGNINVYAKDGLADFAEFASPDRVSALQASKPYANRAYRRAVNENFDFIVSNPPFSIKPDDRTAEEYGNRFEFGSADKSENLFLERWFQLLRPGGRIGVILPESVFDTTTALPTRQFLYRYFQLDAVVSLPYLAFKPYTSTKTCILLATKRSSADVDRYAELERQYRRMIGKAVRRGISYCEAETPRERERVSRLIENDREDDRVLLSEMIGAAGSADKVVSRLAQMSEWAEIDETQWVFRKVAAHFDNDVFYSDVDEVGYKRRRQGGDLVRDNQLFSIDDGSACVTAVESAVLDKMFSSSKSKGTRLGFFSKFSRIGDQPFMRCDPKYRWFWDHRKGIVFQHSKRPMVPLGKFLERVDPRVLEKGPLETERSLIELDDVESGSGRIGNVQTTDEIGSNKIEFGDAQLAFSKLEPYLGKAFLNDPAQAYIGSTEWLLFKTRGKGSPKFWLALLLSSDMREVFRHLQSGKRHARLNVADFYQVLVPDFSVKEQESLVTKLQPLWERLAKITDEATSIKALASERLSKAVS